MKDEGSHVKKYDLDMLKLQFLTKTMVFLVMIPSDTGFPDATPDSYKWTNNSQYFKSLIYVNLCKFLYHVH